MSKKVFMIDNVIAGNNHLAINAGLLNVMQHIYGNESCKITFFGEKNQLNAISSLAEQTPQNIIQYKPIEIILPKPGFVAKLGSWWQKLKIDLSIFKNILNCIIQENPDLVIFNTLIPINLLRFISQIREFKSQRFILVLHGEIEYLFQHKKAFKNKLNAFCYRRAFKNAPPNLKFITLNDLIRERLIAARFISQEQVTSMEHPLSFYSRQETSIRGIPVFAHLGVANKRKGSEKIFILAELLRSQIVLKKIRMSVIGRLGHDIPAYKNDLVNIESINGQSISQEHYGELINEASYALIFLTDNNYVFRVSGSLLDSVQYQLPIIALRHESIAHLFKKGGDIGFICDSVDEMCDIIKSISEKDPQIISRYPQQIKNLKQLAKNYSTEEIANNLRTKLISNKP